MAYWQNIVLSRISLEIIQKENSLKRYREMWVGSILAAHQTKVTGIPHFVGLPNTEPPDVEIVHIPKTPLPSGRMGLEWKYQTVEITRCSMGAGETLIGQIVKKNRDAYSGMILVVYAYGAQDPINLHELYKQLQRIIVKPTEILIVCQAEKTVATLLPEGTFCIVKVYPSPGQSLINISDPSSFFRVPEVVKKDQRAISTKHIDLGTFELLPPEIPR